MAQRFSCKNAGMKTCDFAVESNDEDEIVSIAKEHAKEVHDKELNRNKVRQASKRIQKQK